MPWTNIDEAFNVLSAEEIRARAGFESPSDEDGTGGGIGGEENEEEDEEGDEDKESGEEGGEEEGNGEEEEDAVDGDETASTERGSS